MSWLGVDLYEICDHLFFTTVPVCMCVCMCEAWLFDQRVVNTGLNCERYLKQTRSFPLFDVTSSSVPAGSFAR